MECFIFRFLDSSILYMGQEYLPLKRMRAIKGRSKSVNMKHDRVSQLMFPNPLKKRNGRSANVLLHEDYEDFTQ
jgi:hypothetical protein